MARKKGVRVNKKKKEIKSGELRPERSARGRLRSNPEEVIRRPVTSLV